MELNEFDRQLLDVIAKGRGVAGEGGEPFAAMFQDMELDESEGNKEKLKASLSRLLAAGYINKVDYGDFGEAQYMTAGRYELEKSDYWRGPKWGEKRIKE